MISTCTTRTFTQGPKLCNLSHGSQNIMIDRDLFGRSHSRVILRFSGYELLKLGPRYATDPMLETLR